MPCRRGILYGLLGAVVGILVLEAAGITRIPLFNEGRGVFLYPLLLIFGPVAGCAFSSGQRKGSVFGWVLVGVVLTSISGHQINQTALRREALARNEETRVKNERLRTLARQSYGAKANRVLLGHTLAYPRCAYTRIVLVEGDRGQVWYWIDERTQSTFASLTEEIIVESIRPLLPGTSRRIQLRTNSLPNLLSFYHDPGTGQEAELWNVYLQSGDCDVTLGGLRRLGVNGVHYPLRFQPHFRK